MRASSDIGGEVIRPAVAADAPMLARLHVASWEETYAGLLPRSEFDARPYAVRLAQWQGQIAAGRSRIALVEGLGFAQCGPQRDGPLEAAGYPEELYCLYLLRAAQGRGLGRALMAAVTGAAPFTALVLATNTGAAGFYRALGGEEIDRRPERIGETPIEEIVFGFGGGGGLQARLAVG